MSDTKKIVISVVGARPNFMKVAPIDRALRGHPEIEHLIVHTGQHYDAAMSDAFFADLEMPAPAEFLGVGSGTHSRQTAAVMTAFEDICLKRKPALVLVVGDVNSTLAAALVAKKLGIPVAHVEAGLRSGDRDMPEEINRLATDAIADYAFVTEYEALQHLAREGWNPRSVFFVGNTMIDSLSWAMPRVEQSTVAERLGLHTPYVVVTLHRPSNVDSPAQLAMLMEHIVRLADSRKVLFPMHPRTQAKARDFGISLDHPNMVIVPPMGYVDFVAAVRGADFIVTDSGGIQEETTWMGVPCLTLRTTTERPITVEVGTNVLVNPRSESIGNAIADMLAGNRKRGEIPPYWDGDAARRIAAILPSLLGPGGAA